MPEAKKDNQQQTTVMEKTCSDNRGKSCMNLLICKFDVLSIFTTVLVHILQRALMLDACITQNPKSCSHNISKGNKSIIQICFVPMFSHPLPLSPTQQNMPSNPTSI
jgi:hypothetical protein